jgi:hypothetical protein
MHCYCWIFYKFGSPAHAKILHTIKRHAKVQSVYLCILKSVYLRPKVSVCVSRLTLFESMTQRTLVVCFPPSKAARLEAHFQSICRQGRTGMFQRGTQAVNATARLLFLFMEQ